METAMPGAMAWMAVLPGVAIYCGVQAYRDFRRGNPAMGIVGCLCIVAIMLLPIKTHAVRVDLPQAIR